MSFYFGVAYYPEHWKEDQWVKDIALMKAAHLNVVRMGEFAWSSLEPKPGEFDFGWLERAITQLAEAGIASVLGTPTAAPPAWLVQAHPSILAVNEDGQTVQFGNRAHYCVNSLEFHHAVKRLVDALGSYFGKNPHVIGWQIDNEFSRVCYCQKCCEAFRAYLRAKFGSLETINRFWATRYWSQTYSEWAQIPLPIGLHNPGLMLEFKHFVTESYRKFQRLQIDLLRPQLMSQVWITHNFMRWFDAFDHYALAQDLDLAAWDWYVTEADHDYLASSAAHALVHGYKNRSYWVMETQPGCINWHTTNTFMKKGQARTMAWQAIAHGAEAVLYWQWRSALGGQEQYHGSLVDQSGQPRPFYVEAQTIGQEFSRLAPLLAQSKLAPASIAILNSYESRWSLQWQKHQADFDYVAHLHHYYRPLAQANFALDIVSTENNLDNYTLVFAPALTLITQQLAQRLRTFVEQGGHLVVTLRSGMKDEHNALLPMRQPGWLAELVGAEVEEYYALSQAVEICGEGLRGTASLWAERLRLLSEKVVVMARYGGPNEWLKGFPAITAHPFGQGRVYFVAAYLESSLQTVVLQQIANSAGVTAEMETPSGIHVRKWLMRTGQEMYIAVNHTQQTQQVSLSWPMQEHLTQQRLTTELTIEPLGVALLTRL